MIAGKGQSYRQLLRWGTAELEAHTSADNAAREARELLLYVAGFTISLLYNHLDSIADQKTEQSFTVSIRRRIAGEPLQYILGSWEFYGLPFKVGPGVLIPRPETELLVDWALTVLKDIPSPYILDIGSGSGAIAIAVAKHLPQASVFALELSPDAFLYLLQNVEENGCDNLTCIQGDALHPPKSLEGPFDLLLSNPPYIETAVLNSLSPELSYEPRTALDGGQDGLSFYSGMLPLYHSKIVPEGHIAVEIGYNQRETVLSLFQTAGYRHIQCHKDLSGNDRMITAQT